MMPRGRHRRRVTRLMLAGLLLGVGAGAGATGDDPGWTPREGASLVGTPAPAWEGLTWVQGGPMDLAALEGRVVLVRFWLVDCGWCTATAPALQALYERYEDQGLVVVGVHHPKSRRTRDLDVVRAAARRMGLTFPIAHDDGWQTVRAYGVGTTLKRFTSVSFLIDARGVIRFVHDGGAFHGPEHDAPHPGLGRDGHADCHAAHAALVAAIEAALAEAGSGR